MVLKIEEVDIVIYIICGCGLGDQYTSILTAFQTYNELSNKGYKVKVCWNKNNPYFPSHISLGMLYDLSPFNQNIEEFEYTEVNGIMKEFIKLQNHNVIEVYVRNSDDFIKSYNIVSYMRSHWYAFMDKLHTIDRQFVNSQIIRSSENFLLNKDKIIGIHFRTPDDVVNRNVDEILKMDYYGIVLQKLVNFLEKNNDKTYMICSNNEHIKNFIKEKLPNSFSYNFTHNLKMHNVLNSHHQLPDEILVEHTKEIMIEMVSFKKCEKIYSVNTFPSNFVSYGIIHNEHNQPWNLNPDKIMLDIN